MLGDAMNRDGYVAPMTAAANGEIIDGSARMEVAPERLGDDVIVVEHDGRRPIVAVRTDIPNADTDMARKISVAANRIAEVNLDWNLDILEQMRNTDLLGTLWDDSEIKSLLSEKDAPNEFKSYDENLRTEHTCPKCGFEFSDGK